jgi:hypothetical protein
MQDNDVYQHILGLSSPWTVRERSLGGTLATSTATNAMRQMGSQYQPDAKYQPDAPVSKLRTFSPRNCTFPRDFQHGDTPGDVLHIANILRISISLGKMQKK